MLSKTTIAAAAAALIGYAAARPEFQMRIPNGGAGSEPGSGITCSALGHDGCVGGASRNAFGEALKAAGLQWTKELCEADSDGDGVTNGEELGDPCCLWTPESKNPKGFRVTNLSHPGEAGEDGAKSAPKCGDAEKAAPPSTGAPDSTKAAPAPKKSDMRPVDAADPTPDSGYGGEAPVMEAAPKYDSGYDYPAATAAPSYGGEKPAVDYASEGKCGRYNEPCVEDQDCCDAADQCTPSDWEGHGQKRCLPRPPKCYDGGTRCAGAHGYVFVPYANCCDASLACAEDSSMGWGRFCVAAPSDYKVEEETYVDTYADEIPSMTEEPMYGTKPVKKEKPAKEPAYGQKPVETEAPKHGGGYEKPVKEKSVHDKQGPASAY